MLLLAAISCMMVANPGTPDSKKKKKDLEIIRKIVSETIKTKERVCHKYKTHPLFFVSKSTIIPNYSAFLP